MKKPFIYFVPLALTFLSTAVYGQFTPYFLEDYPAVFSSIDRLFEQEEIDSVIVLSDRILNDDSNNRIKGIASFYKGLASEAFGQNEAALFSFEKTETLFKTDDYEKGLALIYMKLGDLRLGQSNKEGAASLYDRSIQYAKELKLYNVLVDAYQKKATIYTSDQISDTAIALLKTALHFATLEQDNDQRKNMINQVATNYHSMGELDSAIFYFQQSLLLKQKIDDPDGLISDYSALGNLYRERGDYEKAQLQLMKALNIAETEQDSFSMTTIYAELGDIYAAQNIWNVSENYYSRAIQLARLKDSRFMKAGCLKKLGQIFQQQKMDSVAIENYEAALAIYSELKNKVNSAEILVHLGQLYKNESQFEKIKTLLLETLETSSRSQDVMSSLSTKLALAEIEVKLGNLQTGIKYAQECYLAFQKMEDKENLKRLSFLLSEAYAQMGDYRKAYQYYQDYSLLKDSLISVERAEAIKKYDLLVTTKKKDEEIAQQNEKIQNQQLTLLRKNNQVLILAGGLGFIALLAALLFFVYQKNKQLNQQKIQVLKKEQETQQMKAIIEGEEKERKRFARELHDGLGAVLATVKMQISGIRHKFPDVQSSSTYQKAESLIDDACRTVREVSHDLMPHVLEQQGLMSAIDDMCQNLASQRDIHFDFISFGNEDELSDILKITLYRITQELLKNMVKHAEATEVIVQLTIEDEEIILIVEDNGKGFDPSLYQKGIGIENIHSRVAYLNGHLEIESTINQGSTFTIQLPAKQE